MKRQEYQSLLDDYKILRQNVEANIVLKKELREEIAKLYIEYRGLKDGQASGSS